MKKTILTLSILTILLYACKDEDIINTPEQISTQASQDLLLAENTFNDINRVVEDGFNDNGLSKSSCVNYKSMASDSSDADTLIIDFGEVDCLDEYGKLRRGKIIVIYTAPYQDSLAQISTTFDHYYVNSTNWVQGSRTVTNLGRNVDGDNQKGKDGGVKGSVAVGEAIDSDTNVRHRQRREATIEAERKLRQIKQ